MYEYRACHVLVSQQNCECAYNYRPSTDTTTHTVRVYVGQGDNYTAASDTETIRTGERFGNCQADA